MSDGPDLLAFVLGTSSFTDLLDNLELLGRIGRQDKRIAAQVKGRATAREARRKTRSRGARPPRRSRRGRGGPSSAASHPLVASRDALVAARRTSRETLASIAGGQADVSGRWRRSRRRRRARGKDPPSRRRRLARPPPASVPERNGFLAGRSRRRSTSGFGLRWGRMHEGIDIPPVGHVGPRVAAGTVIYAGWLGGYGNLVVVDHGGGLSTAYAHNSSFAVVGRADGRRQGQVIAYSGNTGTRAARTCTSRCA